VISPRSLRLASRDFSLVFGEKKDGFILFIFWGSSSLIARSPLAIWWLEGGGIPCRFPRVAWRISYLLAQIVSEEHAFPSPKSPQILRFGGDFCPSRSVSA